MLVLSGEVDHAVLGALARELGVSSAELPGAIADVHTVDASRITYADSRVLGLVASIAEDTRATGAGSLLVVGASPTLHRMIDLVGLSGRIMHASQPAADHVLRRSGTRGDGRPRCPDRGMQPGDPPAGTSG